MLIEMTIGEATARIKALDGLGKDTNQRVIIRKLRNKIIKSLKFERDKNAN